MDIIQNLDLFKITSIIFAITSLVITCICIFKQTSYHLSIKLLGSLMVLSLSFASDHFIVYALSIFIIATLVTDLDFLEKIAALLWNREKYWEYKMFSAPDTLKGSNGFIKDASSPQKEKPNEPPCGNNEDLDFHHRNNMKHNYETTVVNKLIEEIKRVGNYKLLTNKLISSKRSDLISIFDIIAQGERTDVIFETKYFDKIDSENIDYEFTKLNRSQEIYEMYLRERKIIKSVMKVLVISSKEYFSINDYLRNDTIVIGYNFENNKFENIDTLKVIMKYM